MAAYIPLHLEQLYARRDELIRRKETLYRQMERHGERDERGVRSDKWDMVAGLYDYCSDLLGPIIKEIDEYEEELGIGEHESEWPRMGAGGSPFHRVI